MNPIVTALGVYIPEKRYNNRYFESFIDTNDEWIVSRTGIIERGFADPNEFTSDLCYKAVKNLQSKYNKDISDVDFLIVATTTSDHALPSTASQVLYKLGIPNAGSLDISAACAGFTYGIILAKGLILAGGYKKILVIGAETLSKFADFSDRTTCILFGDGAGAILIEQVEDEPAIFENITGTEGIYGKDLYLSNNKDFIGDMSVDANNKIHQNGRTVFKWAVKTIPEKVNLILKKNNLSLEEMDWLIPHSANLRIIEAISNELKWPMGKILESIQMFGNTSSASIPIAWSEGIETGKVFKGQKLLLFGFGGGLTYAGLVVKQTF